MNTEQKSAIRAYSHDKVAELDAAFSLLDLAGDGYVDAQDIKAFILTFLPSMTEEDYTEFAKECKIDEMDSISFAQFFVVATKLGSLKALSLSSKQRELLSSAEEVFIPYDVKGNGYIDLDIFLKIMSTKGDPLCPEEITELKFRTEKLGFIRKNKVNYRAFISNTLLIERESSFQDTAAKED